MNDILGTSELPEPVPEVENALTVQACDNKLNELEALAPGFSFARRSLVQHRFNRTSVPRADFVRQLEMSKQLKLQEYDREAKVRPVDKQWLAVRAQRYIIMITARRKRRRSDEDDEPARHRRFETATDCAVCQSTLFEGAVSDLPCGHQLHTECLAQLQENGLTTCPTCRHPLNSLPASPADSQASLSASFRALQPQPASPPPLAAPPPPPTPPPPQDDDEGEPTTFRLRGGAGDDSDDSDEDDYDDRLSAHLDFNAKQHPDARINCATCEKPRWKEDDLVYACHTGCGRYVCAMCAAPSDFDGYVPEFCCFCRDGVASRTRSATSLPPPLAAPPAQK